MSYGMETFFTKRVNTKFVVRNIAPGNKCIKLFFYPILNGQTRDLLMIPTVSEADIRHSLLKGELLVKILSKEIEIIDSNIDLLQFDPEQRQFLWDAGVRIGMEAGNYDSNQYEQLIQILRLSDGDGPVTDYPNSYRHTLPAGDPFPTQIIWYDSNLFGAKKITEKNLTYNNEKLIIRNEQIAYDDDGITIIARIVDEFTYNGPFETLRHRTITGS